MLAKQHLIAITTPFRYPLWHGPFTRPAAAQEHRATNWGQIWVFKALSAVQHGHAADGALRPQDPSFFERQTRLKCDPALSVRRR